MKTLKRASRLFPTKTKGKPYSYDMYRDGVTQSMLRCWLNCPTQARHSYLEGWTPIGNTPPYFVYGSIIHWCLEHAYSWHPDKWPTAYTLPRKYVKAFIEEYPQRTGDIVTVKQWALMAEKVLPQYLSYATMKRASAMYHDQNKKWVHLEEVLKFEAFHTVPITGKLDAVFEDSKGWLWLLDTKTSARVDEATLLETLPHDIQMMTYLWLLRQRYPKRKIGGMIYNIMSRPSLRQRKDESWDDFCERCGADVMERPDEYFMRFQMQITSREIDTWAERNLEKWCLCLSLWYDAFVDQEMEDSSRHYYNPDALVDRYGRHCPMYGIIVRGNTRGYFKREKPFPELELEI